MPEVNKKIKVLYLITKSNWGGAQRYVYDLATSLDTTIYEPVVVLGGNGELVEQLHVAGVRTITLASAQRDISIQKEVRFLGELFSIVRKERPDVLHVNSSKAGGVGCFVGRLLGIRRVIFTAHGWAFNEDRPKWQKIIIAYLHWLTIMLSHQTIAVSRAMVTQMKWPLAAHKMVVINPGRTVPEFQSRLQARTTITLAHPALNDYIADTWIMIVGELHPIKQHERLFSTLSELRKDHPRVRLICIGEGELESHLKSYVINNNLEHHIFLIGHHSEAASLLKAADLFVLPSLSESYGYVLHEAGLAEVPIIASGVGGIKDIISDASEGTLINPTDPTELTKAVRSFLEQPHHFSNQAHTLHSKLSARTVQAMSEATIALY